MSALRILYTYILSLFLYQIIIIIIIKGFLHKLYTESKLSNPDGHVLHGNLFAATHHVKDQRAIFRESNENIFRNYFRFRTYHYLLSYKIFEQNWFHNY